MRVVVLVSTVVGMLFSISARAQQQQWIEYEDRVWGFSINFPQEPITEQAEYMTFFGKTVPARTYSVEDGTGRYTH